MNSDLLTDISLEKYSLQKLLHALLFVASKHQFGYACWRFPKEKDFHVLIHFSETIQKKKIALEDGEEGYMIQPFLNLPDEETYFLPSDLLFSSNDKSLTFSENYKNNDLKENFLQAFLIALNVEDDCSNVQPYAHKVSSIEEGDTTDYLALVDLAKTSIDASSFKKVVLGRKKEKRIASENSISKIFIEASEKYENAFVSLLNSKETGMWLTATPEILVGIDNEGVFKTTALAGTQEIIEGDSLPNAVWTQKEIEEQALVSRYIVNCFKQIRLREYDEDGPRTVKSGNLFHLKTDYAVNMKEVNFPELGSVMLKLLHPTSAVCGIPKEVTLDFIKTHELFDRALFSGYIGPVNIKGATSLFVNLRCAQLFQDKIILYAGAGITQDSIPEKEYKETEMKMDIIGRFF